MLKNNENENKRTKETASMFQNNSQGTIVMNNEAIIEIS